MRLKPRNLLNCALLALLWSASSAFINPAFTPVDLMKQSDIVLSLEFTKVEDSGKATAKITKVMKGKFEEKEFTIDLLAGVTEAEGKAVMKRINDGSKQALFFVGMFQSGEEEAKPVEEARGFLHLSGPGGMWQWVVALRIPDGAWEMDKTDDKMLGTWNGGTDQLLRAVNYILNDPDAHLPVMERVNWNAEIQIGKLDGKVYAAAPIDLLANGKPDLFIAAEKGDRLFRWNGKGFDDITAKSGLTSASQASTWGDFNGDGKLDLASFNGKELALFTQSGDGAFKKSGALAPTGEGCLGLTTIDAGGKIPALLVSTRSAPVIVTVQGDSKATAKPIPSAITPDMGEPAECLAADFDDDGLTDIMQLFANGGLFYKGTKPGEFAAPVKAPIATGKGKRAACIGDWDADGLPDVFTTAEDRNHFWQNLGKGTFLDAINLAGSVGYIAKPGGNFAQTSDFNNDGRQGLFITYATPAVPQLFFNRGFRSFGLSRRLEGQLKGVPQAKDGQQAGCLGDFTGVGAHSMALVLTNGEIWLFPRKVEERPLGVTLSLSLASPTPGPVTVWANNATRAFGAQVIRAGDAGAFYGVTEAGPVTVKWRLPGGQVQQKEVVIEEGAVRVTIDKESK